MTEIKFIPETHTYIRLSDNKIIPGVNEILQDCGIIDFSKVPPEKLEIARGFGTAVHKTCELSDLGTLDEFDLDEKIVPYLNGWKKFKKEQLALPFDETNIEKIVYYSSPMHEYAGTLDRIGDLKEYGRTIIEIKTSFEISKATALQTAAYALAMECGSHAEPNRAAVLLKPNNYKIKPYDFKSDDKALFLSALSIYKFKHPKLKIYKKLEGE